MRDVLEFATIRGAECNALDQKCGSLAPGKEADLLMIRTDTVRHCPLNNAFGAIVHASTRADLDAVFIAGQVKKWRGKMTNRLVAQDFNKVRQLADDSRQHVLGESKLVSRYFFRLDSDFFISAELVLSLAVCPLHKRRSFCGTRLSWRLSFQRLRFPVRKLKRHRALRLLQEVPHSPKDAKSARGFSISITQQFRAVKAGDQLNVERVTREIKDPATEQVIRRMTTPVGVI